MLCKKLLLGFLNDFTDFEHERTMATDTIDRFQFYSWWSLVGFGLAAEYDLLLHTDVKTHPGQ